LSLTVSRTVLQSPLCNRADYNPLMGDSSSGSFRPERRGGAMGGGGG